jgi:glucokinase
MLSSDGDRRTPPNERRGAPVLAVDLGGTNMRAAIVDNSGCVLDHRVAPTPRRAGSPDALIALIDEVLGRHLVSMAVVGVPGRVDYGTGHLEHAPNLPPGWSTSLTADRLSDVLGLPVELANDADLAAVGEATFGAGRGFADVVYLTISTGVGAGVMLGGRLVYGKRSLAELGHTVIDRVAVGHGQPATVEQLASGTALARHAAALGLEAEGAELVALVDDDDRARRAWDDAVQVAGLAVANVAHLFAPELVVIGGGIGRSGEKLLAPIRATLATHGPQGRGTSPLVVIAALGDDAGLVGAAAWRRAGASPHMKVNGTGTRPAMRDTAVERSDPMSRSNNDDPRNVSGLSNASRDASREA